MNDCCRKIREESFKKDMINRLSRIEGQIRGIRGMVERDEYCVDILTQISAVQSAMGSFSGILLTDHIKTCVTEDVKNGDGEKVDELVTVLRKILK